MIAKSAVFRQNVIRTRRGVIHGNVCVNQVCLSLAGTVAAAFPFQIGHRSSTIKWRRSANLARSRVLYMSGSPIIAVVQAAQSRSGNHGTLIHQWDSAGRGLLA